jgi:hypothetical protein
MSVPSLIPFPSARVQRLAVSKTVERRRGASSSLLLLYHPSPAWTQVTRGSNLPHAFRWWPQGHFLHPRQPAPRRIECLLNCCSCCYRAAGGGPYTFVVRSIIALLACLFACWPAASIDDGRLILRTPPMRRSFSSSQNVSMGQNDQPRTIPPLLYTPARPARPPLIDQSTPQSIPTTHTVRIIAPFPDEDSQRRRPAA